MNVGIVGDMHLPFAHPNYLRFCKDSFRKYHIEQVVLIGDAMDHHAISFHDHNPDGMSSGDELDAARADLIKWHKAFPGAWVCLGNHDVRAMRIAAKHGLSARYLRDYSDVFNTPTWTWDWSFNIDGVLYEHGTGSTGKDAAFLRAMQKRCSVVMGHTHTHAGVKFHTNDTSRIFGMGVGCGIDTKAYAFEYGRDFITKPTLGCGVVLDSGRLPVFLPMLIGDGEKYER